MYKNINMYIYGNFPRIDLLETPLVQKCAKIEELSNFFFFLQLSIKCTFFLGGGGARGDFFNSISKCIILSEWMTKKKNKKLNKK